MLERIKRKEINRQDAQLPQNIEQLIEQYRLNEVWKEIDKIIDYLNKKGV